MLYLGYDEVAHHSGPWTSDAFGDLKRLDKTFARLRRVIRDKAPRPYDLIILSDHGQSFGPTFLQRYGLSIKEFIEQQLPKEVTVAQAIGGDTGAYGLQGVAGELANMQQANAGSAVSRAVAKQGQKLAERGAKAGAPGGWMHAGFRDGLRQRQRRPGLLRPLPAQDQAERAEQPPTQAWWTRWCSTKGWAW